VVRIEDTDRARSTKEYEDDILAQLAWLGLSGDEFYRQSERAGEHQKALEGLVASDKAYLSKEPAKDDPTRTVEVVRLRNPGKPVTFIDVVRGEITIDTADLGDMVIARSLTDPLYHFAVVVDDEFAGITHVIRGEDHISNTPRQILIQEALGYERPIYAHLPLILAPDRTKMSKRRHATSVADFAKRGYTKEALINFLALLGWNPGNDKELYTEGELLAAFTLEHIQKGGAVFNEEKLKWFNKEYLKQMSDVQFAEYIADAIPADLSPERMTRLLPSIRERTVLFEEFKAAAEAGEYDWASAEPVIDPVRVVWKESTKEQTASHLTHTMSVLKDASEQSWESVDSLKNLLMPYAEQVGKGAVLWPFRFSLTGKDRSPDPFTCAFVLGPDETMKRLQNALAIIG
jgi:glutamyl-tRNA synthetase